MLNIVKSASGGKRILISLATIAFLAGAGTLATRAFFSDEESSSGNTFIAGTLDLQVRSQCSSSIDPLPTGSVNQCGNWDYSPGQNQLMANSNKFFDFHDIKPGDWGENTISFQVVDNDAWMCADLNITTNSELGKYLSVFWWVDDGDNVYEAGEKILYEGPRTIDGWLAVGVQYGSPTGHLQLTFADSYLNWETGLQPTPPDGLPIPGNAEKHLGVAWCFGVLTVDPAGSHGFICDGSGDQSDAQGGSVIGDLAFTVEQARNNPNFLCPEHQPNPTPSD